MNAFLKHHQDNIRFNYRCFDRILLNGVIQPFQQPERVVGFFNTYVRDHVLLRTEPATNNVADYAVNKAIDHLPQLRQKLYSRMPRDFVEVPSQFNEHWALDPAVFANYAKHYKTGEPMPKELVEKIKKSRTFDQGFSTTEYLEAALLDMTWHMLPPDAPLQDVDAFELEALKRFQVYMSEVPPRYHTTYFSHVWGGGYSAGYYAYLWSEVIEDDAFAWFTEHGGMTRENGQRFRDMILAHAGSQDSAAMYRAFRGRDAEIGPLLEERGLKTRTKATE